MESLLAYVIGAMYAAGLYMMLRRNIIRLVMGLVVLSQASNLLIFTAGGLTRGAPPLIPSGSVIPPAVYADPIPQALILTAIVISFGIFAFALVLVQRTHETVGTDDSDEMRGPDR